MHLTDEEEKLMLDCCQGWIDNFYPAAPDGTAFHVPQMPCGMGSFATLMLEQFDRRQVYYLDGHEVPRFCCPAGEGFVRDRWDDRDFHLAAPPSDPSTVVRVKMGHPVSGLHSLAGHIGLLRPELRFALMEWFYGKATHEPMCDQNGQPQISPFEKTHFVYGIQTYHASAEGCKVCPCHGGFHPFMGQPQPDAEPEGESAAERRNSPTLSPTTVPERSSPSTPPGKTNGKARVLNEDGRVQRI